MQSSEPLIGGIELGGTKGIALIARGQDILTETRVPTTDPENTLGQLSAWLATRHAETPIDALGIGSFGPLGLTPHKADYGKICQTPKHGWSNTDVRGRFADWFTGPIGFDTDVNAAACAESLWGAGRGCSVFVYLTIGTGVGGGIFINGNPLHGHMHPEIGHIAVRRVKGDEFAGVCPYHGDCLEGLVAGPALAARTKMVGHEIARNHPIWPIIGHEISELMVSLILTVSPERILIGGGVGMNQPQLFPLIHVATAAKLNGYLPDMDSKTLELMITPPALGDRAGPLGAVALGLLALAAA